MLKLFNTLNTKIEDFEPKDKRSVSFYACGPTVYDYAHIGNFRTYIFEDVLRKVLLACEMKLVFAMNVTDIDDKIIRKAGGKKSEFSKIIKKYEEAFFLDLNALNITKPDIIPHASEYIIKMADYVFALVESGYAYKGEDGSIYFSIDKFKNYGRLSRLDKSGIKVGARVNQDEYTKENPSDFALWKAWNEDDGEIFWETRLGKGRPGWHIECSVMASDVLGDSIDIHAGGVDLIFPHHENEIAQSEARSGKQFVRYWLHGEHLLVDGRKMSKSLGNVYTLLDLEKKGYSPLDFRYLVLGAHYRSKLNFTWEGLEAAKNSRERLLKIMDGADQKRGEGKDAAEYYEKFISCLNDDLNTPEALAVVWALARDKNISAESKKKNFLKMDEILSISGLEKKDEIPQEIIDLAEKRKKAREQKDFAESDRLREKIKENGWRVEDKGDNCYELMKK